jgi:hypothetical protein
MPVKQSAIAHSSQDTAAYIPLENLSRVLRRWWLLALLTIAGGVVGLVVNALRPQPFEAGFRFLTNIDTATSGELTQYQEDITYEAVGALLFSPSIQEKVIQKAGRDGFALPGGYLNQNATVERRLATWQVRVRHADPRAAEAIAAIWLRLAGEEIQRAYLQAVQADGLERYLEGMEGCLARAVVSLPSYGLCSQLNLAKIQAEIQNSGAALTAARLSSRGLSSSLSIDQAEMDLIPARAVSNQRAQMVLAGGLLGFLLGLWALQADFSRMGRGFGRG